MTGRWFQVYARPNGLRQARLGIAVSKRSIPPAIARNYSKRLAREVCRAELAALRGIDLVVRPRTAVPRAESAAARTEIRELLHRAQSLCRSRSAATRT